MLPTNLSTVTPFFLKKMHKKAIKSVNATTGEVMFSVTNYGRPQHLQLEWGKRTATPAGHSIGGGGEGGGSGGGDGAGGGGVGGRPSSVHNQQSSFYHAIYIFAGLHDPPPPSQAQRKAGTALYFGPGVHTFGSQTPHCTSDGVLNIPPTVDVIHLARGAWIEGRFNVTSANTTRSSGGSNVAAARTLPLHVVGHGVISGSRYEWHGGTDADAMRAVDLVWSAPMHIDGPTIVDSKGHALILPPRSSATSLKIIGWLFNEDGVWITSHTALTDSFVRTNDDSIRLYAGAVDHYNKVPAVPRDGLPGVNITVERVVLHQLYGKTMECANSRTLIGHRPSFSLSSSHPTMAFMLTCAIPMTHNTGGSTGLFCRLGGKTLGSMMQWSGASTSLEQNGIG